MNIYRAIIGNVKVQDKYFYRLLCLKEHVFIPKKRSEIPTKKTLWHLGVIIIIFNVINSIPAQALAAPF